MTPWIPRPKHPWQLGRGGFVQGVEAVKGTTAQAMEPLLSGREIDC